jgi:hypothetical protein
MRRRELMAAVGAVAAWPVVTGPDAAAYGAISNEAPVAAHIHFDELLCSARECS